MSLFCFYSKEKACSKEYAIASHPDKEFAILLQARRKEIDLEILLLAFTGPQARGDVHVPRFESYFSVHL